MLTSSLNKEVVLLSAVSCLGGPWENMGETVLPAALYEPGAGGVGEAEELSASNYLPVKTLFSGSHDAKRAHFFEGTRQRPQNRSTDT